MLRLLAEPNIRRWCADACVSGPGDVGAAGCSLNRLTGSAALFGEPRAARVGLRWYGEIYGAARDRLRFN